MSELSDPSLTPHVENNFPGPSNPRSSSYSAVDEGEYRGPENIKDVAPEAGPSHDRPTIKARRKIRRHANPSRHRSQSPRSFSSALEQIHHTPALPLERFAFLMDLEDLRRNMRLQREETSRPRTSGEILSSHLQHERHSHSPTDQEHRTPVPYSTARTTRKTKSHSKRGIGRDSGHGSDHSEHVILHSML